MKRIGVFTSGGDAPGMNACLRAVVRTATYQGMEVYGIRRGYSGMISGDVFRMQPSSVSNIVHTGGTLLKSARSEEFLTPEGRRKAYGELRKHGIEGLVALGGNGTFQGARIFGEEFGIPIVGAPCTIDNDLFGTDHTIGFDTAVNTALDAVDRIRDTADSHERVFFVEVMGRDSGFIAVSCAIGGGAEAVITPEEPIPMSYLLDSLNARWQRAKSSSIVIVAEGGIEGGAHGAATRVRDALPHLDTRVTILGHVQRGGAPSAFDRRLASELGFGCVQGLLAGRGGAMLGLLASRQTFTSFGEAVSRRKGLDPYRVKMVGKLSV
ncbi:6-phosphofructokinase [Sabulibacter ruber]|uniref:6-phosphofructokinase n=1 Tax=Sabulibacter ruber TaxID=2811901 RepID=UPI001A97C091|nr:6-phosphofructokinase [Sabulibacter ruber]